MDNGTRTSRPYFPRGRPLFCGHKLGHRDIGKLTRLTQFHIIAQTHTENTLLLISYIDFAIKTPVNFRKLVGFSKNATRRRKSYQE